MRQPAIIRLTVWFCGLVVAVAMIVAVAFGGPLLSYADSPPLRLVRSVSIPDLPINLDHLGFDSKRNRVFIAATAVDAIEVINLNDSTLMPRIKDLQRPMEVVYIPELDSLAVSCNGDGTCRILDAQTYNLLRFVVGKSDATTLRHDPSSKRLYMGYGNGAIAVIDPAAGTVLHDFKLPGRAESFQIEQNGDRMFVNVPLSNEVIVLNKNSGEQIAAWAIAEARDGFPMALDEAGHRLFICCRSPARMVVFDTQTGKTMATAQIIGSPDDMFVDPDTKRVFISCGMGTIDVLEHTTSGDYRLLAREPTSLAARTSLLVPSLHQFFLAVPRYDNQEPELRIYDTGSPSNPSATAPAASGPADRK